MVKIENISLETIKTCLTPRPKNCHKGMLGNVLVIGGDYGMPGAVKIAAEAALRVGAGLVTVITRKEHVPVVVSTRPELLCYGIDTNLVLLDNLINSATVICIGSGLGQSSWSSMLFDKVTNVNKPLVIDADGLNLLAKLDIIPTNSKNWILTPHPGEAGRLLGITNFEIQNSREESILKIQNKYGCTIVLKGHETLLSENQSLIKKCTIGNPGMASAGMGDLLSGIISGLFAQTLSPLKSAEAGVMLHAHAGDLAMQRIGSNCVLASDLFFDIKISCC
ncbi:MAG: NAD(P)H-hydrate dehydratase [Legionellales bacterium RIFCSPHIGHO2_12_FULL_35_11]|nr:MAG: NAD(P)H-hydrate dehydratase [Legionellales bacterium RIFCSPHIGHO2_12_FULL_35_11]